MEHFDLFIIGGGAAGIAAAKAAWETGKGRIGIADLGNRLGGILCQCAHKGFGHCLTGTEFLSQLLEGFPEEVHVFLNTTVLSVEKDQTLLMVSREKGVQQISFDHLILASGCIEIPAGALNIAGTRPEGIYTAGEMQAKMNLEGLLPEGPVVILGSGDLGLIMAEAIHEAGISVTLVEQKEQCGGLARNRKRVETGEIPLRTGRTITELRGREKLEAVILNPVKKDNVKTELVPCKTLLIAVGLKPDRQLIRGLESEPWITLCGNCHHVHAMVEGVVAEGTEAGTKNSRG